MARGVNNQGNREDGGNNNNQQKIVLNVYLHCQECVKPIVNYLKAYQGVLEVNANLKDHTLIIMCNKDVDPKKFSEKLHNKCNKLIELVSPKPKQGNASSQPKTQSKIIQVLLSIYIHCENCGRKIILNIQKMPGVQSVEMNVKGLQVSVKGEFEPKKLLEYIEIRMGKQASIVKSENIRGGDTHQQQQQQRDNQNTRNTGQMLSDSQPEFFNPYDEFFSDENSQACTIM